MKKLLAGMIAALLLVLSFPAASVAAAGPALSVDGALMGAESMARLRSSTTYVSLRFVSTALDKNAVVTWSDSTATARVQADGVDLTARPGDLYITVNGKKLSAPHGVLLEQGRTLVPVRLLAQAFGASVYWSPVTGAVGLSTMTADVSRANNESLDKDLYWLSRIIAAESRGEPFEGQIAVGNVVLNRVASPDFPDNIYDVIFDDRWGGQFEPVRNGTVFNTPTASCVLAAQLCLDGADVIGDSMFFLNPVLAGNFWTPQNREYIATIGGHDFYR